MTKIGKFELTVNRHLPQFAGVTVLFALALTHLALAQKVDPAFECAENFNGAGHVEARKKRAVRRTFTPGDFFENFYVARDDLQIPNEYRKYVNIDFYGNVIVHLFNGVEIYMIVPKGSELQFMAYVDEGRFRKCVTDSTPFFKFSVSQPGICGANFAHHADTFKFALNMIKNTQSGYAEYKRTVETDDINVRLSNYKLLTWNPVYPNNGFVTESGCNFQREVFDADREIVRLLINTERTCECGAFISFNKELSIAFPKDERPSKTGYKVQLKPRLPLSYSIPQHLIVEQNTILGKTLILQGEITDDVPEFTIVFLCKAFDVSEPSSVGDTPLIVDVRYNEENQIVIGSRNRYAERWNEEHRASNPFSKGSRVNMKVRFIANEIQIINDGEIIDTYKPFVDPRCIDHIQLDQTHAKMKVEDFRLAGDMYTFPATFDLPDGRLKTEEELVVVVRTNARYALELAGGPALGEFAVFHMSVRTNDYLVILNSFSDYKWQTEEQINYEFFPKNKFVEITIKNEVEGLRIKTDTGADYLFHHRINNPSEGYRTLRFPASDLDSDANVAIVEVKQFR